jgi:glycosyltransferase involved in cell wall biosynthesis
VEGVHIREVVKALRNLGHTVFVVSPPGIDPFADRHAANPVKKKSVISLCLGWLSRHIPQLGFEMMELAYNFVAYRNIKKLLSKEKIDFIYERYAFFSVAGVHTANKYKIPFILEVNEISGLKRQRGHVSVNHVKKIEHYIFEHADAIITVSTFLKSLIEGMKIHHSKIHALPNSVNTVDFDPAISGAPVRDKLSLQGKTVMGFMGSFSIWDNLEFLIETFAAISEKYPQLALVLIGDGFNKQHLQDIAAQKCLSEKIIFTGRIPRPQVAGYIAAMDIAIIPDSNSFGSPVVLFEYMAMGKPVIAPRLGPILDVITDHTNGILFDAGNAPDLQQKIISLHDCKELRDKIGAHARKTIVSKHLWQHNAEHIIDLYKKAK